MATTKKASDKMTAPIDKTIQRVNKDKRKKVIVKRIQDEMKLVSQERGKKFRNVDLAGELGIDASLVTKWFKDGAEVKDHHLQAMADFFHCTKSWLDGSGDARVHESYNSVIEKTGLTEAAIEKLIMYRNIDRVKANDYEQLAEAAEKEEAVPNRPKPIPRVSIISEMITHEKFPAVISTLEAVISELPNDAKGHYAESVELHDSKIFESMKNIETILLDCIDDLIEE